MHDSLRNSSLCDNPPAMFAFRHLLVLIGMLIFCAPAARGADEQEIRNLFTTGEYEKCLTVAQKSLNDRRVREDLPIWLIKSHLILGQHEQAARATQEALKKSPWSIRLRLLGREAARHLGDDVFGQRQLNEINLLIRRSPWRYTDAANLVACGEALLLLEAEPRDVLLNFYDRAKKENPDHVESYIAIGQLALQKHDDALAAEEFRAAVKKFPEEPDVHYGLARALTSSDGKAARAALQKALQINPRHVPSLLLTVDHLVGAERYADAESMIAKILAINPRERQAWAYRAVLAHYAADPKAEQIYRAAARGRAVGMADVDHLIGLKLSRNYRFREGAAYQRSALEQDPNFTPATIQLAQDLLRLGEEAEGWRLAQAGFERDGYDVVSYNLITLQENIAKFRTLEDEKFIVRMDAREAEIYGPRVTALLHRAMETLCKKYDWQPTQPVIVEIFADQADFAVRTFGMPGGAGYLGVCFGNVITANSPASQAAHPTNWESVLWHEFCHTVTLNLTHNKMPRWLSEGISVYEERQADSRWGQAMTPQYRKWILDGELTPIGELSGAFSSPPSGAHLQFAYFQSSLVVEYIVQTFGFETVQQILKDLGVGIPINVALERRTNGLAALEDDFAEFARTRAEALAPHADWSEPEKDDENVIQIAHDDPALSNHIGILTRYAQQLLAAEQWQTAKQPLEKILLLYPEQTGADNAYELLARVHRELQETEQETAILEKLASLSADAVATYLRLIQLAVERGDWPAVELNAERLIAVNPLLADPYSQLGRACRELGKTVEAKSAYRTLLVLNPHQATDAHYQLAQLLHGEDPQAAKMHLLRALEEAPRFRKAHRLLLKVHRTLEETKRVTNDMN